MPYDGASSDKSKRWIGADYELVNDDGYITQIDGRVAPVIHQFDRFMSRRSYALNTWIRKNKLWWDPVPKSFLQHQRPTELI